jgi:hypothetical protein
LAALMRTGRNPIEKSAQPVKVFIVEKSKHPVKGSMAAQRRVPNSILFS